MSAETRWDGFLASVEQRHAQILAEAREGCLGLFEACDGDLGPMGAGWTAMQARAQQLEAKISNTWSDTVEPLMEDEDLPSARVAAHGERGRALADALEHRRERVRIALYADAARQLWARALQEAVTGVFCTQCGGPIEVPPTLRALNLPCPSCSARNTFEPGARMRGVGVHCIPPLSEEACLAEAEVLERAQHAWRDDETPSTRAALVEATTAYWTKRLTLQSKMSGEPVDLERELEGRLRWIGRL